MIAISTMKLFLLVRIQIEINKKEKRSSECYSFINGGNENDREFRNSNLY